MPWALPWACRGQCVKRTGRCRAGNCAAGRLALFMCPAAGGPPNEINDVKVVSHKQQRQLFLLNFMFSTYNLCEHFLMPSDTQVTLYFWLPVSGILVG